MMKSKTAPPGPATRGRPAPPGPEKGATMKTTKTSKASAARVRAYAEARAAYEAGTGSEWLMIEARDALRAVDLPAYVEAIPGAIYDLCAASVSRAIDRRERDTGTDGNALRIRYARTAAGTDNVTTDADAIDEAAANLWEMCTGAWIDGETEDGTPRAELSLAYVAGIAAGRGLDTIVYADGGRRVKMTGKAIRSAYADLPAVRPFREAAEAAEARAAEAEAEAEAAGINADRVRIAAVHVGVMIAAGAADLSGLVRDLCAASVVADDVARDAGTDAAEARAEARDRMTEYRNRAAAIASTMNVIDPAPRPDPVGPGPEDAYLRAEKIARVFEMIAPDYFGRAVKLARAFYAGADTVNAAARMTKIPQRTAARIWDAVKAAGAIVAAQDMGDAELLRVIESDTRTDAAIKARLRDAAEARAAADLRAAAPEAAGAVRFTAGRPDRLAHTAKLSPADIKALQELARAIYHAGTAGTTAAPAHGKKAPAD